MYHSAYTQDEEYVGDIASDNVSNSNIGIAISGCNHIDDKLWCRSTKGNYSESYDNAGDMHLSR
jgi:hypothetical protein